MIESLVSFGPRLVGYGYSKEVIMDKNNVRTSPKVWVLTRLAAIPGTVLGIIGVAASVSALAISLFLAITCVGLSESLNSRVSENFEHAIFSIFILPLLSLHIISPDLSAFIVNKMPYPT